MRSWRVAVWGVVVALVATVTLTVAAGTARGCSCLSRDLSEYADDISVAFVGSQLERVVYDYVDDNGAVLVFSVDRVYAGEAGPVIEVRTHAQGDPACGIDMDRRGQVAIAAFDWRGALSVNLCSSIVTQAELESVFGEGRPPDDSIRLSLSPDPAKYLINTDELQHKNQPAASSADRKDGDHSPLAIVPVAASAAGLAAAAIIWRRRQ